MSKQTNVFTEVVANLARLEKERERAVIDAFSLLERQAPTVAKLLVINLGSRRRTAFWMCMTQRFLEGRSAYQALAEGDADSVWDILTNTIERSSATAMT